MAQQKPHDVNEPSRRRLLKGMATVAFAREARTEVRKVIWPTRQETLHTTLIVAAVTAVMSLILWGLDGILVRLVSFITGLRF